jgi:parvulin-like peptidyl-prolyl isomerase
VKALTIAWALLLATILPAAAAPTLAARIDGAPLYAFSVDTLWRVAQREDPAVQRTAVRDAMVGNRLLARAAREQVGEAALTSGARVAFPREVNFDDQLVATLRSVYAAQLENALRKLPDGEGIAPAASALDAVVGKQGGLMLDASLSAVQLDAARKLVLLRYAGGKVTLADVYLRQNVQGRVAILARDTAFMQQQARLLVASRFVVRWSERRFGARAVADLRAALAEQADAQAFARLHGVGEDAHGESTLIDQLARQVTAAEVGDYYRRHRDQFVRIERVYARHIRLPDEAAAASVAALLAGGADFAATARSRSNAPDAAAGGLLGWVKHEGTPGWLAQLVFTYTEGEVSPPVRTPAGPGQNAPWEIVKVEKREQGYQPADSESVRYVASRALAREKAAAQLAALRRHLIDTARVDIVRTPGDAS